ncbi:unnamed protein product [Cunninghamella blakesleeana]
MSSEERIKLLGTIHSSYTIMIRLGLDYYQLPYDMILMNPQTKELKQYSPYGKVPVLLIPTRSEPMMETQVMAKYLDHINNNKLPSLTPNDIEDQLDMTLWISFTNDVLVNNVKGVFLPILLMRLNKKTTEQDVQTALTTKFAPGLKNIHRILSLLNDTLLKQQQKRHITKATPYLLGHSHPTWADFYLYPVLHGVVTVLNLGFEKEAPLLYAWYQLFDQLDLARHIRRPNYLPSSNL